jgi:hypothetical protein
MAQLGQEGTNMATETKTDVDRAADLLEAMRLISGVIPGLRDRPDQALNAQRLMVAYKGIERAASDLAAAAERT